MGSPPVEPWGTKFQVEQLTELADLVAASTGRGSSSREYRGVLRSFALFATAHGGSAPQDLSPTLLLRYQVELSRLAPTTRHHRLLLLRQFLRYLERSGLCQRGLPEMLRIQPLAPHHPLPAISLGEQRRLIQAAPDERSRLLVWLLLGTGARISELLSCRRSSYQEGLLHLCGKTGTRAVPLPEGLRRELEAHLGAGGSGDGPLFRSRQGQLSDRRARELLRECCRRAGLPPLSPHDLRHAACSRWLRAGIPVVVVARTLGHSRPSTTWNHYASVTAQDLSRGLSADPLELAGEEPGPPSPPIPGGPG